MDKRTAIESGELMGNGTSDDGREYTGYLVEGKIYYFYDDDGSIVKE